MFFIARRGPGRKGWQNVRWLGSLALLGVVSAAGQMTGAPGRSDSGSILHGDTQQDSGMGSSDSAAQANLTKGNDLTRQGRFAEAIPLLRRAQSDGIAGYAGGFNLALSYVATAQYREGIQTLRELQRGGMNTAAVNNLLAQAYLGAEQPANAWVAIQGAVKLSPKDEKMYAFLMDACTDHYEYALGLRVAELGLKSLPNSARLHYERAVFLARLDRLDEARPDFAKTAALDPKGDLGYLSLIQVQMYDNKLAEAVKTAREAVKAGDRDYQMLALLGSVLMQAGAIPGQPEFEEARVALESSVAEHPEFSTSQIALGKLYLMEGRAKEAIVHLEVGRRLEPQNPAVYTSLAAAYRKDGNKEASEESLKRLAALLKERTASQAAAMVHPE